MKGVDFPIIKTKFDDSRASFDLNNPQDRKKYFALKVGKELEMIKNYLDSGKTFVGHLLGIKNSGKGTYTKLLKEALEGRSFLHLSIGDLIRDVHEKVEAGDKDKEDLLGFLKTNYRGPYTVEELEEVIHGRSTSKLIPSEFVLSLIKFEISKHPKTTIFFDGFPRAKDQIGFSLYLKELIGYRDDPDVFVFIDVPEAVIGERIKTRLICPKCKNSKSIKLNPTSLVGFDNEKNEFYLMCDNSECNRERLISKEGDEFGIEPIRQRIEVDKEIIQELINTQGIEKIYLRNNIPVNEKENILDQYEITPAYSFKMKKESGEIERIEEAWVFDDDNGVPSVSLLPATVVVSFIKQLAEFIIKVS